MQKPTAATTILALELALTREQLDDVLQRHRLNTQHHSDKLDPERISTIIEHLKLNRTWPQTEDTKHP